MTRSTGCAAGAAAPEVAGPRRWDEAPLHGSPSGEDHGSTSTTGTLGSGGCGFGGGGGGPRGCLGETGSPGDSPARSSNERGNASSALPFLLSVGSEASGSTDRADKHMFSDDGDAAGIPSSACSSGAAGAGKGASGGESGRSMEAASWAMESGGSGGDASASFGVAAVVSSFDSVFLPALGGRSRRRDDAFGSLSWSSMPKPVTRSLTTPL